MAVGKSNKNARGFHNLEVGSLISFLYKYNADEDKIIDENPISIEINDIAKAQFKQLEVFNNTTTKLITFKKVMPSIQVSAYETSLPVEIYQERINIA
tara:strand:+ start:5226 stop:5519 length:294 start_codon:yes stop_codon:yes gene_type:complete